MSESRVAVCVRVRPLSSEEDSGGCSECISCNSSIGQIRVGNINSTSGNDKFFTFDSVFESTTHQGTVFDTCVRPLLARFLEGYNATILAYGQTGSGKTFTMGTAKSTTGSIFALSPSDGILPRVAEALFSSLEEKKSLYDLQASFIELYNEDLLDLFKEDGRDEDVRLCEVVHNATSTVEVVGNVSIQIHNSNDLLNCISKGSLNRATASTNQNKTSSRSHAIFTLTLRQQIPIKNETQEGDANDDDEDNSTPLFESLTSKFHFVDLAGSERLKRTNAVGERAKEGININLGLLALGNVISALSDDTKKSSFVPYRDSKLTRILQNSLGGNSRTLMIACISPSDADFMETLSTLNYANRAKNIKNKATINHDVGAMEVKELRRQIHNLKQQLMMASNNDSGELMQRNVQLQADMKALHCSYLQLQKRVLQLQEELLESRITLTRFQDMVPLELQDQIQGTKKTKNEDYVQEILSLKTQLSESKEQANFYLFQYEEAQKKLESHNNNAFFPTERPPLPPKVKFDELLEDRSSIETRKRSQSLNEVVSKAKRDIEFQLQFLKDEDMLGEDMDLSVIEEDDEERKSSISSDSDDDDDFDEMEEEQKENNNENGEEKENENNENTPSKETTTEDQEKRKKKSILFHKLKEIQQDIFEKKQLVKELEKSQQEIHIMRYQFEGKIEELIQEKNEVTKERDIAMTKMKIANKSEKELEEGKEQFERKLRNLVEQINNYKQKLLENQKLLKQKTQAEQKIPQLKQLVEELRREKQDLMQKIREDQKNNKTIKDDAMKEVKKLLKRDIQKSTYIKQLERDNETQKNLLKKRVEETISVKGKLKTLQTTYEQKLEEQRKTLMANANTKTGNSRVQKDMSFPLSSQSLAQKKAVLDRDVKKCIEGRETSNIMDALLQKREELTNRKRKIHELGETTPDIESQLGYLTSEIASYNSRIAQLQDEIVKNKDGKDIEAQIGYRIRILSGVEARHFVSTYVESYISESLKSRKQEAHIHYLRKAITDLENNFKSPRIESPQESISNNYQEGSFEDETGFVIVSNEFDDQEMIDNETEYIRDGEHSEKNSVSSKPSSPREESDQLRPKKPQPLDQTQFRNSLDVDSMDYQVDMDYLERRSPSSSFAENKQSNETNVFNRLAPKNVPVRSKEPNKSLFIPKENSSNQQKLVDCMYTIKGHGGAVFGLALANDILFSASQDYTVKVWDLARGVEVSTISSFTGSVRAIVIAQGFLFCACESSIKVFDCSNYQLIKVLSKHTRDIISLVANQSETLLFSSSIDNTVRIWDIKSLSPIKTLKGFKNSVTSLAFYEDDSTLITGSKDRNIRTFDLSTFEMKHELSPPHYDAILSLTVSGNQLFTAGGSQLGYIKQWNLENLTEVRTCNSPHSVLSLNRIGSLIVSGSKDGTMKLWNHELGNDSENGFENIYEFKAHDMSINHILPHYSNSISPSSPLLISSSNDRTIRIWKINS